MKSHTVHLTMQVKVIASDEGRPPMSVVDVVRPRRFRGVLLALGLLVLAGLGHAQDPVRRAGRCRESPGDSGAAGHAEAG